MRDLGLTEEYRRRAQSARNKLAVEMHHGRRNALMAIAAHYDALANAAELELGRNQADTGASGAPPLPPPIRCDRRSRG